MKTLNLTPENYIMDRNNLQPHGTLFLSRLGIILKLNTVRYVFCIMFTWYVFSFLSSLKLLRSYLQGGVNKVGGRGSIL